MALGRAQVCVQGELIAGSVFIWDVDDACILRREFGLGMSAVGCVGGEKSGVRRKAGALPVVLTGEEVVLGMEQGILSVVNDKGEAVEATHVEKAVGACQARLAVLRELLSWGWRVTDGVRFGVHFLAYGTDPCESHAPHMVWVMGESESIETVHVAAMSRIGQRTAKTLLVATVGTDQVQWQEVTRCYVPAAEP